MQARVGDRLVVVPAALDQPVRYGKILEVRGDDGSPPFLVRWSDTGHEALVAPGPDAHIQHCDDRPGDAAPAKPPTTRRWLIELEIHELDDTTEAHAVLVSDAIPAESTGSARRSASDVDIPWIGDEIAAARALHRLADSMLHTAANNIALSEGRPVVIHA